MRTNAPQFRGLLNWLITTLLEQTLHSPSLLTLDLTPLDPPNQIGKYQRRPNQAKEGFFLYMLDEEMGGHKDSKNHSSQDKAPQESARQKWEQRHKPFSAEFLSSFSEVTNKIAQNSMRRVYSFGELLLGGPTRHHVRERLANIHTVMEDRGLFIGWALDTGALWNASHKRFAEMSKVARISVQHEEWDDTMQRMLVLDRDIELLEEAPYYGLRAKISINGESQTFWNGYSVHMGSLVDLCDEVGFDIVTIESLEEYFQSNFAPYYHHLLAYQIIKEKNHNIALPDMELAKLFTVFVLQKNDKGRQVNDVQHSVTDSLFLHEEGGQPGMGSETMDESEW